MRLHAHRVLAAAAALACVGAAWSQGCATAPTILVGDTPFNSAGSTETLDLTGICDPGPFGDDAIYHVIWFRWVALSSDNYQVSTCSQANFDTRLAILQSACDPANTFACLDDTTGCAGFTTTLVFSAVQGEPYYIAVGGYSANTPAGSGTLTLSLADGGGGNPCGAASSQDCCVAGNAPGCSDESCCNTVCAADSFCCAVAWDATCATDALALCGNLCVVPCPGPSPTAVESEPCGADLDGGCNLPLPLFQTINVGDVIAGTYWASGGTRDTDWYEFTVLQGTQLVCNVYSEGPAVSFLLNGSCPAAILAASATGCPASWTLCVPPGTYHLFVGLSVFDGFPCGTGEVNNYLFELLGTPCNASAPVNDECETAIPIFSGDTFFDSTFATSGGIPLDPSCDKGFGTDIANDIWFDWTADCDGVCVVSTCNQADFDTRLAVYADCFGTLVTCNDDSPGCGLTSQLSFACKSGVHYLIRVGGYAGGGTGTLSVSCSQPIKNDECDNAIPVQNGDTPFSTLAATTSNLPLDFSCDEGFGLAFVKDIWFVYTATCTGTTTVSTCSQADYDTRLAAYSDCTGTLVACNDDGPGCAGFTSLMTFPSTQGHVYYLRVGGFSSAGSGTLTISCSAGGGGCTSNDTCACATTIALGNTGFSTVGANSDAPTSSPTFCGAFGTGFYRDIWFKYVPTDSGHLVVSTCSQATFDTRLETWNGCPNDAGSSVQFCNDDGPGCTGFTSLMEGDIVCGVTYYIRVGSYSSGITGTGTLTLTLTNSAPCTPPCVGDINGDHVVNGADLGLLLGNWAGAGQGDLDGNGVVNGADLGLLLGHWGPCP